MTAEEAIAGVREAFSEVPRPTVFGRGTCLCSECMEHDALLSSQTPDSITIKELGTPAWDPICYANDQAFAYYLPAMIRLALGPDNYWDQLLFHLNLPGRVAPLTARQGRALLDALWVLAATKGEQIFGSLYQYQLEEAMQRLEYAAMEREDRKDRAGGAAGEAEGPVPSA